VSITSRAASRRCANVYDFRFFEAMTDILSADPKAR
jgi:hypothetical protein